MTWNSVKGDLTRRIEATMAEGGYEARANWEGRMGVIRCGVPGSEAYHFEIQVGLSVDGTAAINVHGSDVMRRGVLRDIETGKPSPERSFRFRGNDTARMGKFVSELRKEVQAWVAKREAYEESQVATDIAEQLQELVARDPDGAGEAIAALLAERFDRGEIEGLRDLVEEANRSAPAP